MDKDSMSCLLCDRGFEEGSLAFYIHESESKLHRENLRKPHLVEYANDKKVKKSFPSKDMPAPAHRQPLAGTPSLVRRTE